MWKPGQLVTIKSKVYRVCKGSDPCSECSISHTITPSGVIECKIKSLCFSLPYFYYFKQVYPKT